ncbi:hypothetical protein [Streptomyces sp. NPDC048623]|uniref:hypothetical protein n=1 Tax=Streptomyces sp. NPDC048623 TaxID=3155761 RepID=UPI003445DBC0
MSKGNARNDRNDRNDRNGGNDGKDRIRKLVAQRPDLRDVSGLVEEAERRVAKGDAVFAADLGIALARADAGAEGG